MSIEKSMIIIYSAVKKRMIPKKKKVSEGPIFTQKRVGKNGKSIHVYKLRTMHPYSEYIRNICSPNMVFHLKEKFRMILG